MATRKQTVQIDTTAVFTWASAYAANLARTNHSFNQTMRVVANYRGKTGKIVSEILNKDELFSAIQEGFATAQEERLKSLAPQGGF